MTAALDLPGVAPPRRRRTLLTPHQDGARGTPRGYKRHRRRGERACGDCKAAWSRASAAWGHTRAEPAGRVDDVAVQRAIDGDPVKLTPAERAEAVRRLHARGMSDPQIARQLHVHPETVRRWRGRLGLLPVFSGPPRPAPDAATSAATARTEATA